ncbi:MAG: hypothetical protein ACM3XN_02635 [Chloroflexota bacterium]
MSRYRTALETAAVYVGAIVGAGFASGREIYIFFVRRGDPGLAAAVAAGLLLGAAAALFLPPALRAGATDYSGMCRYVGGRLGRTIEAVLSLFLFAGLAVMLAAGATVTASYLPLSYSAAVLAMALVTAGFVVAGPRGVTGVNNWLVPYLTLAVLAVSVTALNDAPPAGANAAAELCAPAPAISSLLLYVGYNFVTGAAVLISLPPASARQRAGGALLGGVSLSVMLGVAALAMRPLGATIAHQPLPLLDLARGLGPRWALLYVPAIGFAILTTAVADAYALARRFSPTRPWLAGVAAVALAVPLANRGFVTLVDNLYPLLGLIGLLFVVLAIWRILRPKTRLS